MERNTSIDIFRGLSVILMVFFTLILILSNSLPDLLKHGVPGIFYPGDLVLSFFIFASGMSLSYFFKKRENLKRELFFMDLFKRIFLLFLAWIIISPFSSGEILGMDEIGLILLLFIFTLFLHKLKDIYLFFISILILILYLPLSQYISFSGHLGGYNSLIFYIPLILSGFALGRNIINKKNIHSKLILISFLAFIILSQFSPIDKLLASPSFISLSILSGSILFLLISNYLPKNKILEYLGKNSLRYWVLMFLFFIIPAIIAYSVDYIQIPMSFDTITAIIISFAFLIFFAMLSFLIDKLIDCCNQYFKNRSETR